MDILLLLLLIAANATLALAEIAVISADIHSIRSAARRGNKRAIIVEQFKQNPQKFLSSIQVGITLVGVLAGAIGGARLAHYLTPLFQWLGFGDTLAFSLAFGSIIAVITTLNIILGELVPKTLALQAPEKMALRLSTAILYFSKIFAPAVFFLTKSTEFITQAFGIKAEREMEISEDEIRKLIKIANQQGVLENKETELLQNIFRFANRYAEQMMTPIRHVKWLDVSKIEEARNIIYQSAHTKYLVSNGKADQVEGYLNIRNLLMGELPPDFDIKQHLSQPVFLNRQENALEILEKFRDQGCYFGIVRDYQQKVMGIITLHNLIEGIFGMLPMKGEAIEPPIIVREDGTLLVSGQVLLDEIMDHFQLGMDVKEEERFETIAHFLVQRHPGIIPSGGEVFKHHHLQMEIVDVDGIEIDKVLITCMLQRDINTSSEP